VPIHDWSRGSDAAFHSFQLGWTVEVRNRLNSGVLPKPLYAITETIELRPDARFAEFPEPDGAVRLPNWEDELRDSSDLPPRTSVQFEDDRRQYATVIVTVRDDLHQPRAAVLWVTRQDHETPYRLDSLLGLSVGALTRDIGLLVVDLFPPSKRDPRDIHKLIWDRIKDEPHELPADKPLTLASYSAGGVITAYVENVGVGDPLPDMPVFLRPYHYVPCPLESTYQTSWAVFPKELKAPLESPDV
jgi:hypothetical protein